MRIMPSGKGDRSWIPTGLVKTASSDGEILEEKDELFEAAKKVVAEMECNECGNTESPVVGGDDFETETNEFETDNVEFEGEVEEVSEETDGEEGAVECLQKAKEAIEEAVECLEGDEAEEFEVEVEDDIDDIDEEVEEVDVDVDVEGGANCVAKEQVCEKCECDPCECAPCCDSVEASSNDWVKLSAISPSNRKKIYDYWANQLDFPKDFVKLMVKDYEK